MPFVERTLEWKVSERTDFEVDYRIIHPVDGAIRYHRSLGHLVAKEQGELEFIGMVVDVIERRRAEEELRRSETYLTEAQRLSHTASWAWNVSTGNLFWSSEHFRILGLDPEQAQPSYESFFQMIHAQDRPSVKQTFERAVDARGEYEMDYRIIRPDGMIRHIHSLAHPAFNDSGELTEYVGTIIDISERKRAEEALRDSNKELQSLNERLTVTSEELEVSKDELQAVNKELEGRLAEVSQLNSDLQNLMLSTKIGTIFLDRWLRIKRYTPQIPRLFNIRPADINRPIWHLTHRLDHMDLQADAQQVLADLQGVEREVRSAEGHWYIVRLLPYRTQDDTIDGVVVTFVEITERKRTEAALRETQAALAHAARVTTLGELTASIAHEVNQPLAAIVTNGQACLRLLARATPDLVGVQEAVESTISDALRASEVIKRIRALLRKTGTEKVPLNVNEIIQEVIALAASELGKNQILLRTELAAGLRPVLGDRVQLQQVLLNLILNANDAMSVAESQLRQLQISSQASKPAEIMVTVRDSGPGLDPQTAERVFDAFFTTKTKGDGLGLGLSISRTIIEAHGGRLWATPNEGQGAIFRFTLPSGGENQSQV